MWRELFLARRAMSCGSVLLLGVLNSGCTTLSELNQLTHRDQFTNAFNDGATVAGQPTSYTNELLTLENQANAYVSTPDMGSRNDYISMKMFNIDHEYFEYTQLLYTGDTGIVSVADFAQLGLTTAATAIPVVQTTKILATIATGVGGGKAIYGQDVLKTQTLQAIQTQMDADRSKIKNQIVWRMANCKDDQSYPMGFILSDLQSYAAAGTVQSAIAGLVNSASKAKQASSSPSSTASADGTGGGSASDSNAKSVDVYGGKLTYSFKPATQCPLVETPKTASGAKSTKKIASLVQVSGTLQIVQPGGKASQAK
jgi:hypothetical protein